MQANLERRGWGGGEKGENENGSSISTSASTEAQVKLIDAERLKYTLTTGRSVHEVSKVDCMQHAK